MKYLIVGGTGSLGNKLTERLLSLGHHVTVFSRDEYKQTQMAGRFKSKKLSFVLGDIRDKEQTLKGIKADVVIHAAALKHVPVGEFSPYEVIKTNILGTMNVIDACKANGVKKAILVSTDKACHPVNLYGATKFIAEKLFTSANQDGKTVFASVRYGNVVGSRGSIVEYILKNKPETLGTTDLRMTRFWLSLDQAVDLVLKAVKQATKGQILVPKAPATKVTQIFKWLSPKTKINVVGMRAGEKLHEAMINKDESLHTTEYKDHFVIEPEMYGAKFHQSDYQYTSESARGMTKEDYMKLI